MRCAVPYTRTPHNIDNNNISAVHKYFFVHVLDRIEQQIEQAKIKFTRELHERCSFLFYGFIAYRKLRKKHILFVIHGDRDHEHETTTDGLRGNGPIYIFWVFGEKSS